MVTVIFSSPPTTRISLLASLALPTTAGAPGPSALAMVLDAVPVMVPVSTELVTSTVIV